jgi:ACS family hexuronate transporter-like MFS transporter
MKSIGQFAGIPFLVAGFGNILGGWFSSALLKRGVSTTVARKSAVTFFCVLMMSAIPAVLAKETWVSIAFVSIAMLGYTGGLANMLTLPSDVFPKHAVSSVYGLASMGSGFGGMLFTLITGWVVEHYSYTPVFIGFGFVPLICATILWTLVGPLRPISVPQPGVS